MSFSYSIDYTRQDDSHGGIMGSRETLSEAIADAAKSLAYYQELGYTARVEYFAENCPQCGNSGEIRRGKKWHTCKACKGAGFQQEMRDVSRNAPPPAA